MKTKWKTKWYEHGYYEGCKEGYRKGFAEGKALANKEEGFQQFLETAYNNGRKDGYAEGSYEEKKKWAEIISMLNKMIQNIEEGKPYNIGMETALANVRIDTLNEVISFMRQKI